MIFFKERLIQTGSRGPVFFCWGEEVVSGKFQRVQDPQTRSSGRKTRRPADP